MKVNGDRGCVPIEEWLRVSQLTGDIFQPFGGGTVKERTQRHWTKQVTETFDLCVSVERGWKKGRKRLRDYRYKDRQWWDLAGLTDMESFFIWLSWPWLIVFNVFAASGHTWGFVRARVHRNHTALGRRTPTGSSQTESGASPAGFAAGCANSRGFEFLGLKEKERKEGCQKGWIKKGSWRWEGEKGKGEWGGGKGKEGGRKQRKKNGREREVLFLISAEVKVEGQRTLNSSWVLVNTMDTCWTWRDHSSPTKIIRRHLFLWVSLEVPPKMPWWLQRCKRAQMLMIIF